MNLDQSTGFSPVDWQRRYILVTLTDASYQALLVGPPDARDGLPERYAGFVAELRNRYALERIADWPLATLGIRCLVFEQLGTHDPAALTEQLERDPRVETAQLMENFEALQLSAPDTYSDPYIDLQHAYGIMNVAAAHRMATGKGVRIAVIDTGVDLEHLDIAASIEMNRNHVNEDESAFRTDIHGTAVAAIISASVDDQIGMAGVAPQASILALKACWPRQIGDRSASCNSYTIAKALNFAIAQEVDIINLSLGGPADRLLQRLVEKALARGIIVVAALHPTLPDGFAGGIDGVMVATADDLATSPAPLAARTISAPGTNVLSARPGNQYDFFDGSSLSAAHLSGLLALMRERRPHLSPSVALSVLKRAATDATPSLSACDTLSTLVNGGPCPLSPAHQ